MTNTKEYESKVRERERISFYKDCSLGSVKTERTDDESILSSDSAEYWLEITKPFFAFFCQSVILSFGLGGTWGLPEETERRPHFRPGDPRQIYTCFAYAYIGKLSW